MDIEVKMIPVSAGDATLIIGSDGSNKHTVLIDSGLHKEETLSYLHSIGVFHLDLIILSHPDMDHLGGLLSIIQSRAMSIDRIWCFDLGFLREFIKTGKIPRPEFGTRPIVYEKMLYSTLDRFSDILKTANNENIQVLQVSEGYKISLGKMLIEVLYPPQEFYDSLSNPIALKNLLIRRRWPTDWIDKPVNDNVDNDTKAKPITIKEQDERLTDMIEGFSDFPNSGVLLTEFDPNEKDTTINEKEGLEESNETIPLKMIGTLYNNMSIVVKVSVLGGIKFPTMLFAGDLSDWTTLIIHQLPYLKADIFKLPHHGSKHIGFDNNIIHDFFHLCKDMPYICKEFLYDFYPFLKYYRRSARRYFFPFVHSQYFHPQNYIIKILKMLHDKKTPIEIISEIVKPSQTLIYPHPAHNLPNADLTTLTSNIISNRTDRKAILLNSKKNMPYPATLSVGFEKSDIREIKT